jgi:hypothetical protein
MAGGTAVFLSGYALKRTSLELFNQRNNKEENTSDSDLSATKKSPLGKIFLLGLALGIPTAVMFSVFPDLLEQKLSVLVSGMNGKIILVYLLVLSALISLPISGMVNRVGLEKSFRLSLAFIVVSMLAIFFFQAPLVVIFMVAAFTIMFTVISVSSLPLVISNASNVDKVFCVGVFFSGVALPDGIFAITQSL